MLQGKQDLHQNIGHQQPHQQQQLQSSITALSVEQPLQKAQSPATSTAPGAESALTVTKPNSSPSVDALELAAQHGVHASQHSRAAADSASAQQAVCSLQDQVAALEKEKTQLSAQLSAAHSCMQEMEADAMHAEDGRLKLHDAASHAEQQRQIANEVTQVWHCLAASCNMEDACYSRFSCWNVSILCL